jgi:predicted O-methyltransferase YrrM
VAATTLTRLLETGPPLRADDWSLARPALELVLAAVDGGRHEVVECGSGLSTVLIARRLRELGAGHVHSLEHDEGFAAACRRQLERESLTGLAEVIEAPLRTHPASGVGWYDRDALTRLPAAGVQLLLVDGPPAGTPELERSRYPALAELRPRLAPGAVVICDDALRPGERWVLDRWRDEEGLSFEIDKAAGIAHGALDR